jgi:hypothetical protein
MAVFSVVMGLVFYVCVQALRLNAELQERADLHDTAETVLTRIASDLLPARSLLLAEEARIAFITPDLKTVTYEAKEGTLLRNGRAALPAALTLSELRFDYTGNDLLLDTDGDSLVTFSELDQDANGSLEDAELLKVSLVQISLSLARGGKYRVTLQSSVKLRNPQSSPLAEEEEFR